ncbi:MAG: AAA family ATPase, partial [Methanobrevibacter sp.]|nr:AAA family ATPase [Methanobrevibacter sp.]
LNYSNDNREEFIRTYDKVRGQYAILWNITMALNWIRPYDFINLDANNREILSTDDIFTEEFKNEIKSLNSPPNAQQYLHICEECKKAINESEKYENIPLLSHSAYINKITSDDDGSDEGIGDSDVKTTKYWLISPGYGAGWWDDFYRNGEMGIGFDGTGDLSQYKSKEELKHKFQEMAGDKSSHKNNVHACWQFVHDIQIGDVVFVKNGMSEIIGRGIVEGDYEYDATKQYHKLRKVKWTHRGHWEPKDKLPMKTLTDITNYTEFVNDIKELFVSDENGEDEVPEIQYPEYTYEKFLEEVYISENDYNTLVDLVKNKKNLIVEGAPGVGKTFMAKRLAYSIMGVKDTSRVMMVQFHQSYSYEDFVMGYRPSKEGFELRQGSFYNFCKKAEEDSENDYFFIIDEINRGNLSKIFGELFMLIENDKRGEKNKIQLLYSDELFFIPKNVYIIGLMNTADRSLAMIDYALRRRFAFFDLKPGFTSNGFKDYQSELENAKFDNLVNVMNELNSDIKEDESLGEGFRIGHSYLCNLKTDDIDDKLNYIVEYELIPLLKEYWFDEPGKVDEWADRLRSAVNDS